MTEDELLTAVMDALQLRRNVSRDTIAQHIRRSDLGLLQGAAGLPDVLGVMGSTLIAWELKELHGRVDREQAEWLAAFGRVDRVDARVIRPAMLDELVEDVLRGHIIGRPLRHLWPVK